MEATHLLSVVSSIAAASALADLSGILTVTLDPDPGPAPHGAAQSAFDTIAIIVLVPVYDRLLAPRLRWTYLQRIGWGLVVRLWVALWIAPHERPGGAILGQRPGKKGPVLCEQEAEQDIVCVRNHV